MAARVQIVLEAKDAASGVLRGITSSLGGFGKLLEDVTGKSVAWGNLAADAAGMVVQGVKEAYKAYDEYAKQVRDVALASGESAEEASRLIQVLDDFEISAQDVTAATRAMTKQGLAPNLETLAQLSDQYLAITDAQERNAFVIQNLGRAGLQWTNVLKEGGAALRGMSEAVDENLILTDEQIESYEKQRLALDALADAWQGVKVQVGAAVGEQIAQFDLHQQAIQMLKEEGIAVGRGVENTQEYKNAIRELNGEMKAGGPSLEERDEAFLREAQIIEEELVPNYKDLINNISNYQDAIDTYTGRAEELQSTEEELMETRRAVSAELAAAAEQYGANSDEVAGLREQLAGVDQAINANNAALHENANQLSEWAAQAVFSFAQARAAADGEISAIEGEVLIQAGEALGLFDEQTAAVMSSVNESFDTLDPTNAEEVIANLKEQLQALVAQPYNIVINAQTNGVPSGNTDTGAATPQQMGGMVYAGRPYWVGEGGAEPFMPSQNGRILGHAESLHALSLGGGGQTNYIYGPVTLQIADGSGGSLLEMR